MPEITTTINSVEGLLKGLNPNNLDSGPHGISSRLLKELHVELAPILAKIYRSSLSTGNVSEDWKTAFVQFTKKDQNVNLVITDQSR